MYDKMWTESLTIPRRSGPGTGSLTAKVPTMVQIKAGVEAKHYVKQLTLKCSDAAKAIAEGQQQEVLTH